MVFQERTYSVLLVSAGEKFSKTLTELLPPTHFWPVNLARSTDEARRALLSTQYDMVLINAPCRTISVCSWPLTCAAAPTREPCCWSEMNSLKRSTPKSRNSAYSLWPSLPPRR